MAKPIYAGTYQQRGRARWKTVFFIIVLLHIAAIGAYLIYSKGKSTEAEETVAGAQPALTEPDPLMPEVLLPTPESQAALSDAKAAIDAGQLVEAKASLDRLVTTQSDAESIKLLGQVNMKLLRSPLQMPGKEYYAIQGGDSLSRIAKKYNTTVTLLKQMNGLETDVIRRGARLLVFNGDFTIRVSKSRNQLDLMLGEQLFKRYLVGTGKFGKTPAVQFSVSDKIVEPPWTRPTDNRQIEYGDPENVLGTRWMALKSTDHPELTGFGIHGTWERDSIGKQSSAGCIRMLNEDVEELFDLVPRKTAVIITD